jgi:hypothetical protein
LQLQELLQDQVLAVGHLQALGQGQGILSSSDEGGHQWKAPSRCPVEPPGPLMVCLEEGIQEQKSAPFMQPLKSNFPVFAYQQHLQFFPEARAESRRGGLR